MRSSSSASGMGDGGSGSRVKKKHKKLDAICEEEYNRNHGELNEGDDLNPDLGVRRSSRVRRAPVLLDVSPSPKRKRQKLGKDVMPKSVESDKSLGREGGGNWSLRSRSRGKNVEFEVKEEMELPRRKRKLSDKDLEVVEVDTKDGLEVVEGNREEELEVAEGDREEELEVVEGDRVEELEVVENDRKEGLEVDKKEDFKWFTRRKFKSKNRTGKIEATNNEKGLKENECQEVELLVDLNLGEGSVSVPETELADEDPIDLRDENASLTGNEERIETDNLQAEECNGDVEPSLVECVEIVDEQGDQVESEKDGKNGSDVAEIAGVSTERVDNEGSVDKEVDIEENVSKDKNVERTDELKQASNDKSEYRCIKEGRRCGLCGRGSDGKPPKRLIQDNGESENEAYSGSSASEEPTYDTWDGFDDEPGWLGRLLGPINDRYGIAGIWVHQNCAVWSPEVLF
ncbi:P-loop containing nucleoside triphosphate hydrolases superfamily protein [Trifolium pratense]|uniref:P-loop containing nucleoside triphosphate hydrolases superfamily protein n=1 Tax=Trifolium pratense TaxID=57577 RepID=A0A2K3LFF5_TRIPR|nr:P-loop containing nucleoside triphosphate hydrolases superfamily protein [Trifolium pratense]